MIGLFWITLTIHWLFSWQLPKTLASKTVILTGFIDSLPQIENNETRIEFAMRSLNGVTAKANLALTWFNAPVNLAAGDYWQLAVRLKPPQAELNPGGFDYEQWLFAHKIRATGYVINSKHTHLMHSLWYWQFVNRLRESLLKKVNNALAGQPTIGLIAALITGSQSEITPAQWQVMQATGTNHLMAIAGVHIGFFASFIYFLANFTWRRNARLMLWLPASQFASVAALLAAFVYSALAGFALPTQRALIMLSVFMLGIFLRRNLATWNSFLLALLLVLLLEPLSIFTVSFWLSFAAVAFIVYGMSGRREMAGFWWKWVRLQWLISVSLIPFTLWLFGQASLISLVANLFAVPAVGFLILPLCLLGVIGLSIWSYGGKLILWLAAKLIAWIWQVLTLLAACKAAVWYQVMPNVYMLLASIIGVTLLLAPAGWPARWLGLLWLMPLVFYTPPQPKDGEVWFTLLDVGQGLAAVVQTHQHTLLYETWSNQQHFDTTATVVLQYLRYAGVDKITLLMLSHSHKAAIDVTGFRQQISLAKIMTNTPAQFSQQAIEACQAGQYWQWDGVTFTVLYPLANSVKSTACVLRISNQKYNILLTGDVGKAGQQWLINDKAHLLPATILVAPHYGSKNSVSKDFIEAVQAKYVLFSLGFSSHLHFPNEVGQQYQQTGVGLFSTATSGALVLKLPAKASPLEIIQIRVDQPKIWRP